MAGKTCPQCGAEYELDQRFCSRDGATLTGSAPAATLEGSVVANRYLVLRQLGEGGMGQVYLAEHVRIKRKCALKVMRPVLAGDADALGRFSREALNASRIEHPNVASIFDFGETDDGMLFLAMEYVPGSSLAGILERERTLAPERVARLVSQVADALGAAHELGIVHRDLKPDNIMVVSDASGDERVKLVDFGISKVAAEMDQKITVSGTVVGTPAYMSPEQARGEALDARSDVYALGIVVTQMLTGALPFEGEAMLDLVAARLTEEPRRLGTLRPEIAWGPIEDVVARAVTRSRDERYGSAREFARALSAAVSASPAATVSEAETMKVLVPATREAAGGDRRQDLAAAPKAPSLASAPKAPQRRAALKWIGAVLIVVAASFGAVQLALPARPQPLSADSVVIVLDALRQMAADSSDAASGRMRDQAVGLLPRLSTALDSAGTLLRLGQAQLRLRDTLAACASFQSSARAAAGTATATVASNSAVRAGCR